MALSARTPTTAATNYFVPTIYAKRVEEAAKDTLVIWDAFDTSWERELVKGNVLDIAKSNTVTATEVVVGSKGSALNPLNTTGVQLTINQWYEAPVDLDYMTKKQSHNDPESIAVTEASYAVSVKMDNTMGALFSGLGGYSSSAYGTDGQTLTDDILLYCLQTLMENNVPMDDNLSIILDPSGLVDMMKLDKFISTQYGTVGPVKNGKIGKSPVYGGMVRVTNNLTAASKGNYAVFAHKKALAGAAQIEKAWRKEFEELHQTRYQSEALWGVIELNDTFGIPFYTRKS